MKCCTKCGEDYKETDFPFRDKKNNLRHKTCKYCQRKKIKAHYESNKSDYIARAKLKNKEIALAINLLIQELKNVPCADCGQKFPYYAMDFDHVRGKKIESVSGLKKFHSISKIKKEIAKCEVVCANCHRIRTFNRLHKKDFV